MHRSFLPQISLFYPSLLYQLFRSPPCDLGELDFSAKVTAGFHSCQCRHSARVVSEKSSSSAVERIFPYRPWRMSTATFQGRKIIPAAANGPKEGNKNKVSLGNGRINHLAVKQFQLCYTFILSVVSAKIARLSQEHTVHSSHLILPWTITHTETALPHG